MFLNFESIDVDFSEQVCKIVFFSNALSAKVKTFWRRKIAKANFFQLDQLPKIFSVARIERNSTQ